MRRPTLGDHSDPGVTTLSPGPDRSRRLQGVDRLGTNEYDDRLTGLVRHNDPEGWRLRVVVIESPGQQQRAHRSERPSLLGADEREHGRGYLLTPDLGEDLRVDG